MKKKYGINKPAPKLVQLLCRHEAGWYRVQSLFFNLSGEMQYLVCNKCGKKLDERFIKNFDCS